MARPSVTEQRLETILDALERCVARFGVDGATLDALAKEADLSRSLIRHHGGNREQLLDALFDRFFKRSDGYSKALTDALPTGRRVATLLDILFDPIHSDQHFVRLASALTFAADTRPELGFRISEWINDFVGLVGSELKTEYPEASDQKVQTVAAGVSGIYFSADSYSAIKDIEPYRKRCKRAAELLVSQLSIQRQ